MSRPVGRAGCRLYSPSTFAVGGGLGVDGVLVEPPGESGFPGTAGPFAGAGRRGGADGVAQVGADLTAGGDLLEPGGDGLLVGVEPAAEAAGQAVQVVAGAGELLGAAGRGPRGPPRPARPARRAPPRPKPCATLERLAQGVPESPAARRSRAQRKAISSTTPGWTAPRWLPRRAVSSRTASERVRTSRVSSRAPFTAASPGSWLRLVTTTRWPGPAGSSGRRRRCPG